MTIRIMTKTFKGNHPEHNKIKEKKHIHVISCNLQML